MSNSRESGRDAIRESSEPGPEPDGASAIAMVSVEVLRSRPCKTAGFSCQDAPVF